MLLLSHFRENRRLSWLDCTVGATGSGLLAVNRGGGCANCKVWPPVRSLSVGQMYCLLFNIHWFINSMLLTDAALTFTYLPSLKWWYVCDVIRQFGPRSVSTIHFVFTVGLLYCTVLPSYSVLEQNQCSTTLVAWVVLRKSISSSASRDFLQFHTWDTSLS